MSRNPFRGRRALVTGGLGFIGSTLARRLCDLGARVTAVDSLIPEYGGNPFNLDGYRRRIRVDRSDVRDRSAMDRLVRGQDFLFNLAGQVSHLDSMRDPFTDLEINCRSPLSILESCRRLNPDVRIVFSGTRQVYGRPRYLPVDEDHLVDPVDVNGVNKVAGEWYHLVYHRAYGMRTTSLRLTNTYGPRMRVVDARQTFLGIWIRRLIEGRELLIYGTGRQKRDLNFVDDAVEALLLAAASARAEGRIYNLGGREVVSLRDLARRMIAIHGSGSCRLVPFPPEQKPIDIGDYAGDFSLIRRELGWTPRVALDAGLRRTLDYYRAHARRYWPA